MFDKGFAENSNKKLVNTHLTVREVKTESRGIYTKEKPL